jgi:hypothetical protein
MSKQQTAVEWLMKMREKYGTIILTDLVEAKEMEKEQIETAYNEGREFGCKHDDPETGEDYYNLNYTDK